MPRRALYRPGSVFDGQGEEFSYSQQILKTGTRMRMVRRESCEVEKNLCDWHPLNAGLGRRKDVHSVCYSVGRVKALSAICIIIWHNYHLWS